MAEHPNSVCGRFINENRYAWKTVSMFERFWNATASEEPECTLLNLQLLHKHFDRVDRAYKRTSAAYDEIKATENAEEIEMHTPEYEAIHKRHEELKDIVTSPKWNQDTARQKVSRKEWRETSHTLWSILKEDWRAAGVNPDQRQPLSDDIIAELVEMMPDSE